MGRTVTAMVAGCAFLLWFSHAILLGMLPTVLMEAKHLEQFHPAAGSRIVRAKCTNVQGILFHTCTIEAITAAGERVEVTESALGRAPNVRVGLLLADASRPIYSSTLSMADMRRRVALLAISVPLAILGLLFVPAMPFLVLRRIRQSGLTASGYFARHDELRRQYRARRWGAST